MIFWVQAARILNTALRDSSIRFCLLNGSLPWLDPLRSAAKRDMERLAGNHPMVPTLIAFLEEEPFLDVNLVDAHAHHTSSHERLQIESHVC